MLCFAPGFGQHALISAFHPHERIYLRTQGCKLLMSVVSMQARPCPPIAAPVNQPTLLYLGPVHIAGQGHERGG